MALFGPNKLFLPILVFPFNRFGISEVLVQENAQQVFLFCFVLFCYKEGQCLYLGCSFSVMASLKQMLSQNNYDYLIIFCKLLKKVLAKLAKRHSA